MTRITTLSVTGNDIINASLRKLQVLGEGETVSTEDHTNCLFGLNLMLKARAKEGAYLWKIVTVSVPMVAGNNSYQIGDSATGTGAVVTNRMIRMIDSGYIRNDTKDLPLIILSRQEYNNLSAKATSGPPNQIYYDPQLYNGILKVYPTPNDSTRVMYLTAQIPIFDFVDGTEALDIPQEGYQACVYGLADEMMDEYPKPDPLTVQRISAKAQQYWNELADWSQEETSVFFQPNIRG